MLDTLASPVHGYELLLEEVLAALDLGDIERALPRLIAQLDVARSDLHPVDYRRFADACRRHPLYDRLNADPFTRRCRQKPRGYAGDAVMLDYIYRGLSQADQVAESREGREIFRFTGAGAGSAAAVRERRVLLAKEITAAAGRVRRPRILSLACGHLREAELLDAVAPDVEEIVALDQDAESLREITDSRYSISVRPVQAGIISLLKGSLDLGTFDLIYSAGLYDYLQASTSAALTTALAKLLRPGGRLFLGNFLTGFATRGYMECFMEWQLISRSFDEVNALFAPAIAAGLVGPTQLFADSGQYVVYASCSSVR